MLYLIQSYYNQKIGSRLRKFTVGDGGSAADFGGGKPRVIGGRKAVRPTPSLLGVLGRQVAENLRTG